MNNLESLTDDQIVEIDVVTSTPSSFRALASRHPILRKIWESIEVEGMDMEALRAWVRELMKEFKPGERFRYSHALAALAVLLERIPGPFADDLLEELAGMNVMEMAFCSEVARLVQRLRRHLFTSETSACFTLGDLRLSRAASPLDGRIRGESMTTNEQFNLSNDVRAA